MNKLIAILTTIMLLCSCGTTRYVPVEVKTDSIYVERIVERIDTIRVEIPVEVKETITFADSSHLETSVAVSDAWIDSLSVLHHKLRNKTEKPIEKEIPRKDKIIETTIYKEVPVIQEVEVPVKYIPGYYKWINVIFWSLIAGLILAIVLKVLFKFK